MWAGRKSQGACRREHQVQQALLGVVSFPIPRRSNNCYTRPGNEAMLGVITRNHLPALDHYAVDGFRASRGRRQPVAFINET